jgi:hypothetical protein
MTTFYTAVARAEISPENLEKVKAAAKKLEKPIEFEHEVEFTNLQGGASKVVAKLSVSDQMSYGLAADLEQTMIEFLCKHKKKEKSVRFSESSADDEQKMAVRLVGPRCKVIPEALLEIADRIEELLEQQEKILMMLEGPPTKEIEVHLGIL